MYELFDQLKLAFESKNEDMFKTLARLWIDNDNPNPFAADSFEHNLFFKARTYCFRWHAQGIDSRSAKRNMVEMVRRLMENNPSNPYSKEEKIKETKQEVKQKEKKIEKKPEAKKEEKAKDVQQEINNEDLEGDIRYLLMCMTNAYNEQNEASYEMYLTHLLDIATVNPFKVGTDEYEMFATMQICWNKVPPNKRRSYVVGKQLCNLINNTEIEPEEAKQTILGVLPDEKKSWFKFLFPWKKEGESDDGAGIN